MKHVLSALVTGLFLSACATPLDEEGQQVRVISDANFIRSCEFKGSVESSSGWGGSGATGVQLKNLAAERGGNVLLMATLANTMGGTNLSGDSYRCQ